MGLRPRIGYADSGRGEPYAAGIGEREAVDVEKMALGCEIF